MRSYIGTAIFLFGVLVPGMAGADLIGLSVPNGTATIDRRTPRFKKERNPAAMFDGTSVGKSFYRMGRSGTVAIGLDEGYHFSGTARISDVTFHKAGDRGRWREAAGVYFSNGSEQVLAGYLVNTTRLRAFRLDKDLVVDAEAIEGNIREWEIPVPEGEWTTLKIEDISVEAFRAGRAPDGFDIGELSFTSTEDLNPPPEPEPVPEPATLALVGLGISALAAGARWRRKQAGKAQA